MDIGKVFETFAQEFLSGDHLRFAESCVHPLVIYAPGSIRIEKTVEDTHHALSALLDSARMRGATRVSSEIRLEPPILGPARDTRQPVRVTWTFRGCDGRRTGEVRARYFVRLRQGRLKIELIEVMETTLSTATLSTVTLAAAAARH